MSVSPFDGALWTGFWGDPEIGPLFTDAAEIEAMLAVEGALARVQGALGIIPTASADGHRCRSPQHRHPAG